MKNTGLSYYLEEYLKSRPPFLGVIRAKEAFLYQKYLPLRKPVLDMGCGDGFFTKLTVGKVELGLDLKNSRMKEANGVYEKKIVYDGLKIPLKSESVATVMCNSVLEHVSDLDKVLNEIYRVLKKGGIFVSPVMAKPWEDYIIGGMLFGRWYKDWLRNKQEHCNLLTRDEWRKSFKKAGFRLVEETGHLSPRMCKTIELLHYWSVPNLILYKLTGKWTLDNEYLLPIQKNKLLKIMETNVDPNLSGGIFYVWRK